MKRSTPHRARIASVLAAALSFGGSTLPANAAALLNVHADIGEGRAARAVLTFDGGVPQYRVYGNGTADVSLLLVGTTRPANMQTSIDGRDALKSISVEPVGDNVEVTFHEAAAARVNTAVGGGQSLVATIVPVASVAAAPPAFGAQPLGAPENVAPPAAPGGDIEVVPLKYADVSEVVGLLVPGQQIASNDVFTPQEQSFGTSGGAGGGFGGLGGLSQPLSAATGGNFTQALGTGGGSSLGQQINENIGVDRRLNAIILSGSPDVIAALEAKIAKIDIPLPSVVLETQVVELTDSAARDVGLDFTNGGGPIASATYQIKNLSTGMGAVNLQAAVFAEVSNGEGQIIARPRVVAQSGGSAQIVTGDALPIVTSIAVSGVNAVSQQVQYVNVGVSLQIQPRVSSDGFVTSHIFSEVSSVTGYQQGYPTLSQREATTSATVKDGEAFVIGGLLQRNDIRNLSKLPGIGDLPIIGGLFHVRHNQSMSTNLYIIVVPHILTGGSPVPPDISKMRDRL
jgi:general secretion pathway protein D